MMHTRTNTAGNRPALRLIVNESPSLSTPRPGYTRLAAFRGRVVDPFYAKVLELADRLISEHRRLTSQHCGSADDSVRVTVPAGYSEVTIGAAFDVLRRRGCDLHPAAIYAPTSAVYLSIPAIAQ